MKKDYNEYIKKAKSINESFVFDWEELGIQGGYDKLLNLMRTALDSIDNEKKKEEFINDVTSDLKAELEEHIGKR